MPVLVCERDGCSDPLPPYKGTGRRPRYCAERCRNAAAKARKRAKQRRAKGLPVSDADRRATKPSNRTYLSPDESVDGRASARRGPQYEKFCDDGWPQELDSGAMTAGQVAKALGTTGASISRWMAAYREDLIAKAKVHERTREGTPEEAKQTLDDFAAFRSRYFRVPDEKGHVLRGVPYKTPEFQQRWVDHVVQTIDSGGKFQILAPPRHGKTELLNHFCIWLIARNPNIRILMVGGAEDIAAQSIGQVKDELENNEALINDFGGPAGQFKPGYRSGKSWSADRFTIEGRTVSGLKSPTMAAIGRGGRLLSRDADLIIVDDIEDHDSTVQPHAREKTRNWFRTQLLSRKEPHTAIFVIGSRQHAEDLYSSLLDDPTFVSLVETAHDDALCGASDGAPDADHQKCTLFPSLRPLSWLMEQQSSMGRALYEMVYLNRPRAEGLAVFSKEAIDACKTRRVLGEVPDYVRLVAGLDPASTGYQAAVLWGYHVDSRVRYLIDVENEQGGGVAQARNIIERWYKQYGCRQWVVEENNFQKAIRLDETLRAFCLRENIALEPHETHKNKWDPQMGVTAMAPLFEEDPTDGRRHVDLPWGNADSERRVLPLIRQWLNFSDSVHNKRKGYKSDLVMAGWFPEKIIRRWRQEFFAEMAVEYAQDGGVQWEAPINSAPWGS